jgi:hypothetical protein
MTPLQAHSEAVVNTIQSAGLNVAGRPAACAVPINETAPVVRQVPLSFLAFCVHPFVPLEAHAEVPGSALWSSAFPCCSQWCFVLGTGKVHISICSATATTGEIRRSAAAATTKTTQKVP